MTFKDIFKSSFINNITAISAADMIVTIALAFCIGLLIFYVYKKTYRGVMYSSSFGVTLVALTMITSQLILAVTSNVVLSLGMVGALSIVRFRTAIKEPLDIAFLFWSLASGIILAAGLIPLGIVGSIVIGAMLLIFCNKKSYRNPYMVVLTCEDSETCRTAMEIIEDSVDKYVVKSKSARKGNVEVNMEVRLKNKDTAFIDRISVIDGVKSAVLVSYNGEFAG